MDKNFIILDNNNNMTKKINFKRKLNVGMTWLKIVQLKRIIIINCLEVSKREILRMKLVRVRKRDNRRELRRKGIDHQVSFRDNKIMDKFKFNRMMIVLKTVNK